MAGYKKWLDDFSYWLKDIKDHEVEDLVNQFVEKQQALKTFSEEKLKAYSHYLKRDLKHLEDEYRNPDDIAWQELKAGMLFELAQLEDRTQLEWQALLKDFEHDGVYKAGEWIAMGQLVCKNCHHTTDVLYASEIKACSQCEHHEFSRKALSP
ncbi:zinc ribbon-containing protein [Pseudoalteromonas phenolica]|uniref:zinc ribbon-containing protein n=1 Tax=Pseudoalteromonas phenolica TaxID=161398 RepID=UPI00110C0034|nr:hypothetical protein [Pseudoalteromonas phenolica]TMO56253.1 hypothetical protein CWC21_07965 [Pseudoalteromonas phenolica]